MAARALPANDIAMWIDFFTEDAQLQFGGGRRGREWFLYTQLEACGSAHLLQLNLWMKTENLHALGVLVIAENGQIGNNPIGTRAGRQTSRLARPGPR